MSTIRLFYGRDTADMVRRIRDAAQRAEGSLGCPSTHPHVSRLEVRETVLEDEVIEAIVDLIEKQHDGVDTVLIDDCGAYLNKQAVQMARALGQCRDVQLNEPTFLTKFFLESFLVSATRLQSLRIQDRFLTDQIEALAKGLTINTSLHDLDLSRSRLLENSTSILSGGLKHNTSLRSLKLRSLSLKDNDVEQLLSSLVCHPTLQVLDVSFNYCRQMGPVATFLRSNTQIQELYIGYQNMWQAAHLDVSELATALAENTALKCLSLARCKLTDDDAIILADALRQNSTLEHLDVRENQFTDVGIQALAYAIGFDDNTKCALRKISIVNNPFGDIGMQALLDAARNNWNLCCADIAKYQSQNRNIGNNNVANIAGQIQFYTALNRGGRKLLVQDPPLSLWPSVLQRIGKMDWDEYDNGHSMSDGREMDVVVVESRPEESCPDSRAFDIAYFLLRNGPAAI
jgi:Ran GTPase-activating protein (RanGAP) involved in mRNA processing and transport